MALSNLTKVQTLGIGSNIEVVGVITTGQFKSGTSNLHASGVDLTNLNVSGIATIGGNVSIGGTLTYQDVTNVDSVGIITAQAGISITGGDLTIPDSIIHLGDTNTKIRFPAADTITVETAGNERLRIKSNGYVGIGTDNPADKLSIYAAPNSLVFGAKDTTRGNHIFQLLADNSAGDGELRLYKNSGSGTHEKTVEIASSGNTYFTGGNFGIGTNSPDRKLDVSGTGNVYGKFQSTNTTGAGIEVKDASEDWLIQADGGSVDGLAFYDLGRTSYRFVMGNAGQFGIGNGGSRYGTSGQVLTSGGASGAVSWTTITGTTINSNSDNRVITGSGTANTLNAESTFVHDPVSCDTQIVHNSNNVADLLVQNNSSGTGANARLTLQSGSNSNAGPQLGMINGSHTWYFQVPKAAGNLEITNNGTLDFLMADDGDFHIIDGDLVFSTAGHGIDFSATGDASGGTSELLDDYEEGSWTPYIYPMSSNIPVTYSHQSGRYQKIGNVVHFQFKLQVSNITGNRNQGFGISGFPYNNTGSQDYQTTGQFFGVTWDGEMPTTLVFTPNTTRGVCYYYADAMKYYSSSMLDINVNNSMLSGSGHYFTHV